MNASLRYALITAATAVVILALAVLADLIAFKNPVRVDLTKNKRHSLSEQTVKVLEELEHPVQLTVFLNSGDPLQLALLDLFEIYRYHSDQFAYEVIDPDRRPGRAEGYNLQQYGKPVAFFETEAGKRESVTGIAALGGLEEKLTNALIKVTRGRIKRVYVLQGHGEASLGEEPTRTLRKARAALEDKSYVVEPLPLLGQTRIPADCDVLLVPGPAKELHPTELQAVRRYLERGGRALIALDPQTSQGLVAVLRDYGLNVGLDVIIDRNALNRFMGGGPLVPICRGYPEHIITKNFTVATYFPEARSVTPTLAREGVEVAPLVVTSEEAYAETSFDELQTGRVGLNGADRAGPLSVAAVVEWKPQESVPLPPAEGEDAEAPADTEAADAELAAVTEEEPEDDAAPQDGRLAVFGDSDFLTDQHFDALGNSDLFLNAVSWLSQEEDLIAVRPKSSQTQFVTLTATQGWMIFVLPVVVLPALVLAAGGVVWWRRTLTG